MKIRVVNVVDLMTLQAKSQHPHGLEDSDFDALFTKDKPVIFAYHGYPTLIHRLTYKRANHDNFHVHGFRRKAPRPRPSTWWCGTGWIAFTSPKTLSTACRI